jgi:hypothetical protein
VAYSVLTVKHPKRRQISASFGDHTKCDEETEGHPKRKVPEEHQQTSEL